MSAYSVAAALIVFLAHIVSISCVYRAVFPLFFRSLRVLATLCHPGTGRLRVRAVRQRQVCAVAAHARVFVLHWRPLLAGERLHHVHGLRSGLDLLCAFGGACFVRSWIFCVFQVSFARGFVFARLEMWS